MKIGLLDIDSKIANLALMKISSYHKKKGDQVEWYMPLLHNTFDKIYCSKIFNYTPLPDRHDEMEIGGTGYDIKKKLPFKIEKENPDYFIYKNCEYSLQLFSRGCIRKCSFCIVPDKEGSIKSVDLMILNPKGKWIEILDNNFFANPTWKDAIYYLIKMKKPVNFHGVDVRILTEEHCYYLNKLKHKKQIHIAWDQTNNKTLDIIKNIIKHIRPYKLMCYVLIGYDTTHEHNLYRVKELQNLGIDPFVMPYKRSEYELDFGWWVNRHLYKTIPWKTFVKNRRNK